MEQNDNHKALVLIIGLSIHYIKTLRNEMLEYCRVENKTHRSNVLMDFNDYIAYNELQENQQQHC